MPKRKVTPVKEDPNKKPAKEESSSELNPLFNRDLFCQIGTFLDLTSLLRLQSVSKKIKTHSQACLKSMFSESSTEEINLNPRDVCKMFANKKKFKLAQNDWKSGFFKKVNVHMIVYFYAHDRFPGGNADMNTKKWDYSFLDSKATVKRRVYSNWDGQCMLTPIFDSKLPDPSVIMDFFDKAAGVISSSGSSCEFQIADNRFDSENGDCEWYSISVKIDANSIPILNYKRNAVYRDGREPPKVIHPETPQAKEFFEALCELTGEVRSLTWEQKKCRSVNEEEALRSRGQHVATDVYDMPITLETDVPTQPAPKK